MFNAEVAHVRGRNVKVKVIPLLSGRELHWCPETGWADFDKDEMGNECGYMVESEIEFKLLAAVIDGDYAREKLRKFEGWEHI